MTDLLLLLGSKAENILFFVFIGIFVLTALLTLASLPNWIKLDEWYRKKLFLALILEVVGIILMVAQGLFRVGDSKQYEFPVAMNWVALHEDGTVKTEQVKVMDTSQDSTYYIQLGKDSLAKCPDLYLATALDEKKSEVVMMVMSENDVPLGQISSTLLYKAGLFNLMEDITSHKNYALIRWEKQNGKWKMLGDVKLNGVQYSNFMDEEVRFDVYGSTRYKIYNSEAVAYTSSPDDFDYGDRMVHFCKNPKNNTYYQFRIMSANLTTEPYFVNVAQIRLDTRLNFNEIK